MATETIPRYTSTAIETLSAEDFETASIRSAAPSYISEAPSYHSTVPINETIPPYSPPANNSLISPSPSTNIQPPPQAQAQIQSHARSASSSSPAPGETRPRGLPPVTEFARRSNDVPMLDEFRIPLWSHINSNPTYKRVAHRRASAAVAAAQSRNVDNISRIMMTRIEEERTLSNRFRPLEDPYLVGEEAAARARRERLARENGDVLFREDRRWDWFLTQVQDRDGRERLRREFESMSGRPRLARGTSRF